MSLLQDIYTLSPGIIIELFELDATSLGGSLYRFHAGTNEFNGDVVWATNTYSAFPIEVDGFEQSTRGTLPKPTIRVANIDGVIGALNRSLNDLVGAKLTRKRTLGKYLDAANFTAGNALADPTQYFADEVFYINRKVGENRVFVDFELASIFDLEGVKLPRRQIIQNVCPWIYRGIECTYAGSNYWDADGNVVGTIDEDVCGKKLTDCKLRFGEYAILPYGGFPGSGLF